MIEDPAHDLLAMRHVYGSVSKPELGGELGTDDDDVLQDVTLRIEFMTSREITIASVIGISFSFLIVWASVALTVTEFKVELGRMQWGVCTVQYNRCALLRRYLGLGLCSSIPECMCHCSSAEPEMCTCARRHPRRGRMGGTFLPAPWWPRASSSSCWASSCTWPTASC